MKSRLALRIPLVVACCLALNACSSMWTPNVWPFPKKPKPVPEAVNELNLVNTDGTPANFPQYWKRNTLVIDLSAIGGGGMGATGNFAAQLPEGTPWPVRVAVRVRPASVGQVEVLGEERNVLLVTPEGTLPIDLEFSPSVYTPRTAAIYISWGPIPAFAEAATPPEQESPVFVSPTEVPKTSTEAAPAGSASDIVTPAEAQASPPGS